MVDAKRLFKMLELGEKVLAKVREKAKPRGPPTVRDRRRSRQEVTYR